MTDYLAKAREKMPPKKDMIIGRPERFGFNECHDLCLPIVADLLKRVDELKETLRILLSLCNLEDEHGGLVIKTTAKIAAQKLLEGKR